MAAATALKLSSGCEFAPFAPAGVQVAKALGSRDALKIVDGPEMPLHRQCLVDPVGQGQGLGSEAAELDIVTVDFVEIEQSQGRPDDVQRSRSCAVFRCCCRCQCRRPDNGPWAAGVGSGSDWFMKSLAMGPQTS